MTLPQRLREAASVCPAGSEFRTLMTEAANTLEALAGRSEGGTGIVGYEAPVIEVPRGTEVIWVNGRWMVEHPEPPQTQSFAHKQSDARAVKHGE